MESLDFPSIHSIEKPAPPDTLTLPPPSPVDDPSHPRREEPLPSAIEAAADASASGSGPPSGKPPSPFPHRPPTPRPRPHGSGADEGDDSEGEGKQPQSPKDPHPQKRAKTEGAFQCLHTCFADPQHKKEFSHRSSRDRHMSSLFLHPSPSCGDACPGRQPVLKFEADKLEKERKAKGEQDRGAKDEAPAEEGEEGAPASKRKSRKGKGGGGGAAPTSPLPSAPSLRPSAASMVLGCHVVRAVPLAPQPNIATWEVVWTKKGLEEVPLDDKKLKAVLPFVFIDEVASAMERFGVAVFCIPVFQLPWNMEENCQPRHWPRLMKTPATVSKMKVTGVNVPDGDEIQQQARSFEDIHDSQAAGGQRKSEESLWEFIASSGEAGAAALWTYYLRDLEEPELDVWGTSTADPSTQVYKADKGAIRHHLNLNLFSKHAKSLFSLMDAKLWEWKGVASGSFYLKTVLSLFRAHFEQGFLPAHNMCRGGASTWYFVHQRDMFRLKRFLVNLVRAQYPLEAECKLTAEEEAAIPMLLYSRQLWLSPAMLHADGIPVQRVVQTAGQAVVTDGCVLHWGVVTDADDPHCLQEAINYCPQSWLSHGLKRLVDWMGELRLYLDVLDSSTNEGFKAVLCGEGVQLMLAHHSPSNVMIPFLAKIREDILKDKPSFAGFKVMNQPTKDAIAVDLDKMLQWYKDKRLAQFFLKFYPKKR